MKQLLGLPDEPVELVLESIQVSPAFFLGELFVDSPITIYSDGLMSYGPTRRALPPELSSRIGELVHLDLLPGVQPVLLTEHDVPARVIPDEAFIDVVREASANEDVPRAGGGALVIGQFLSALELMAPREEVALYLAMVKGAMALGHERVRFKPHPSAPGDVAEALHAAALAEQIDLLVEPGGTPLERVLQHDRPDCVIGCFSTGLLIAHRFFGVPAFTHGCRDLLRRLTPFENSNRVPLVAIDVSLPPLLPGPSPWTPPTVTVVQDLVAAVAYAMQPVLHEAGRADAVARVRRLDGPMVEAYLPQVVRARLGLPGVRPDRSFVLGEAVSLTRASGRGVAMAAPVTAVPYRTYRRLIGTRLREILMKSGRVRLLAQRLGQ